jgi:SRSO17 transposase
MTADELEAWGDDFVAFQERFAHLFSRREPREQCGKYLRGLMASMERKNGWQLAEIMGDETPDRTQRLLYQDQWDADEARDILQELVKETFGEEEGIGIVDETGFLKKGTHSVGVKRQYSGTAGKVENCQVGTFLSYATSQGHVFLDRRLYLPEEWSADATRRAQAKVPEEVCFQSKPEQAIEMLAHAWAQGIAMRWVVGDEVYGKSEALRDTIRGHPCWYVLAVPVDTAVWVRHAPGVTPVGSLRPVAEVVANWAESQWQRLVVVEGEKGPRVYDWACQRVLECREGYFGPPAWLLARRSVNESKQAPSADIAYYLAHAPADIPLLTLAQVTSMRYTVEQCIEEAKGETGLDEYQVRYWHSWYRHITLSMMAHTWLAFVRAKSQGEKRGQNLSWPS